MRAAPRERIGLALGAWGAVQTTAAGIAIGLAGIIRDAMLAVPGAEGSALPYLPVFALEILLLALALLVALPLVMRGLDKSGSHVHVSPAGGAEAQPAMSLPRAEGAT